MHVVYVIVHRSDVLSAVTARERLSSRRCDDELRELHGELTHLFDMTWGGCPRVRLLRRECMNSLPPLLFVCFAIFSLPQLSSSLPMSINSGVSDALMHWSNLSDANLEMLMQQQRDVTANLQLDEHIAKLPIALRSAMSVGMQSPQRSQQSALTAALDAYEGIRCQADVKRLQSAWHRLRAQWHVIHDHDDVVDEYGGQDESAAADDGDHDECDILTSCESGDDVVTKSWSLPDDIVMIIFSFLSPKRLCKMSLMSRQFLRMSRHSVLWRMLYMHRWPRSVFERSLSTADPNNCHDDGDVDGNGQSAEVLLSSASAASYSCKQRKQKQHNDDDQCVCLDMRWITSSCSLMHTSPLSMPSSSSSGQRTQGRRRRSCCSETAVDHNWLLLYRERWIAERSVCGCVDGKGFLARVCPVIGCAAVSKHSTQFTVPQLHCIVFH